MQLLATGPAHASRGTSTGCPVSIPGDEIIIGGRIKIICEPTPEDDTTAASVWGKPPLGHLSCPCR